MDDEYAEYRCSACKKDIKSNVVQCKKCIKLFYHPGCVSKHRVYDKNSELVACPGPFAKFSIDSDKDKEADMRKASTSTGLLPRSSGSTGSAGSNSNRTGDASGTMSTDEKINWLVKAVKEIKDDLVIKREIKTMIKEVVREELGNIKQELGEMRRMIQETTCGPSRGPQRSYSEVIKEKKKENVIIVKPKIQQESEATKKLIKEKVDIKSMAMGITKLKKGSKGTVIMGCEAGEEVKKLKETVQAKLGENYNVMESPQSRPKIKIINIGLEEMNLDDNELINTIKMQNKMGTVNIRIVKRMIKEKRNKQPGKKGNEEGSIIIEADEETHEVILKKVKLNIGWKKCPVFNHINVKRCFKCWGYYHIAKNCTREETCFKCAGSHNSRDCTATKKKCVNCMFKNQTYNLRISDDHDALSPECPTFKRALQEEKRRAGWEDDK